jgi:hypothetical protein
VLISANEIGPGCSDAIEPALDSGPPSTPLERFAESVYRLIQQEDGGYLEFQDWRTLDESYREHFRVNCERILSLHIEFNGALEENYYFNCPTKTR